MACETEQQDLQEAHTELGEALSEAMAAASALSSGLMSQASSQLATAAGVYGAVEAIIAGATPLGWIMAAVSAVYAAWSGFEAVTEAASEYSGLISDLEDAQDEFEQAREAYCECGGSTSGFEAEDVDIDDIVDSLEDLQDEIEEIVTEIESAHDEICDLIDDAEAHDEAVSDEFETYCNNLVEYQNQIYECETAIKELLKKEYLTPEDQGDLDDLQNNLEALMDSYEMTLEAIAKFESEPG